MVKKWLKKFFIAPKFLSDFTPDLKTRRQKRPFIIPSRFGLYFGTGILVLLGLAYTYANQLIYLIAFFYSSVLFITMHLTNNNIKSVEVSEFFIRNFFQDEAGKIKITIHNQHSKYYARFIQIELPGFQIQTLIEEIPPNSYKTVELSFAIAARGKHEYSKINLSTKFPFNLFYSWKRISWSEHFFSYPAREGAAEPPYTTDDEIKKQMDLTSAGADSSSDSFLGHREYTAFENPKRIDWKVYARKNKFFVKTFETEASLVCFIDLNVYLRSINEFDKRLKQLSKWIFEAQKRNALFYIRLKNDEMTVLDDRKKVEAVFEKLSLFSAKDFA